MALTRPGSLAKRFRRSITSGIVIANCCFFAHALPAQAASVDHASVAPLGYSATKELLYRNDLLKNSEKPGELELLRLSSAPTHTSNPLINMQILQNRVNPNKNLLLTTTLSLYQEQTSTGILPFYHANRHMPFAPLVGWFEKTRASLRMGLNGSPSMISPTIETRWIPMVTVSKGNFKVNIRWIIGPSR